MSNKKVLKTTVILVILFIPYLQAQQYRVFVKSISDDLITPYQDISGQDASSYSTYASLPTSISMDHYANCPASCCFPGTAELKTGIPVAFTSVFCFNPNTPDFSGTCADGTPAACRIYTHTYTWTIENPPMQITVGGMPLNSICDTETYRIEVGTGNMESAIFTDHPSLRYRWYEDGIFISTTNESYIDIVANYTGGTFTEKKITVRMIGNGTDADEIEGLYPQTGVSVFIYPAAPKLQAGEEQSPTWVETETLEFED